METKKRIELTTAFCDKSSQNEQIMANSPAGTTPLPNLDRDAVLGAINNVARLKMLTVLCDGEPIGASELGEIAGCTSSAASKHAWVLVNAGIVMQGRGRLFRLVPGIQTAPGRHELEFGHCLLRLDYQPGS
jgi:hypothetical protein